MAVHPGRSRREGRSRRSPREHSADPSSSKVGRFEVKPVHLKEKPGRIEEENDGTPGEKMCFYLLPKTMFGQC